MRGWLWLCAVLSAAGLCAQRADSLVFTDGWPRENHLRRWLDERDTLSLNQEYGANLLRELQTEGYWLAEANWQERAGKTILLIHKGPLLRWGELELIPPEGAPPPPPLKSYLQEQRLDTLGWQQYTEELIDFYENQGYPFVRLQPRHYALENDRLNGSLAILPGPRIYIDSLAFKGIQTLAPAWLRYELGIEVGGPYREKVVRNLPARLEQIEFINASRLPAVGFYREQTTLFLYLEEARANQIDGVVGLNTESEGRTRLNGDFQLRLLHTFHRGEEINLRWRRPDESVQELDLGLSLPYLFQSPFWWENRINIFRQDSSFVNSDVLTAVKYRFAHRRFIGLGYRLRSSRILGGAETGVRFTQTQDFRSHRFSVQALWNNLNRPLVPLGGFRFNVSAFTGNRRAEALRQNQYGWEMQGEYYRTFAQRWTLRGALGSEALFGDDLFDNELYRIGGLQSLRGFNEQSIFTSLYVLPSVALRYRLGDYDFLSVFSDWAYTENRSGNNLQSNWLWGLGSGLSFRTGGGIFSLYLAVGRSSGQNFDFRATKVHFGYVNRF